MKNKVLTNSLRTLTSNILILETKQLKTSFWEVRLLYFSFFKKSFVKVTQALLSFFSFFRSFWLIPLKPFFPEISSFFQFFFGDADAFLKTLGFQLIQIWWVEKGMSARSWSMRSILYGKESLTGMMPSAQTLGASLLFCGNTGFYSSKAKISFAG